MNAICYMDGIHRNDGLKPLWVRQRHGFTNKIVETSVCVCLHVCIHPGAGMGMFLGVMCV